MLRVMDVYTTVLLKKKDISTADFLINLNNGLRLLNAKYSILKNVDEYRREVKTINDILDIPEALSAVLAAYILANIIPEDYAKYMSEFTAYSEEAATYPNKKGIRHIPTVPFTRS